MTLQIFRSSRNLSLAALILLPLSALMLLSSCKKDRDDDPENPFIKSLAFVDGKLLINGNFGADPGAANRSVRINDAALPSGDVFTWDESTIVCLFNQPVPDEIAVEVITNNHKSNRKILTVNSDFRITYLQVWEDSSKLYIYGKFGADPGSQKRSITVKGVPVESIQMWTPALIICKIPRVITGSYGEVVVKRGPNESTSRLLYRWSVKMDYLFPQGGSDGTLRESIAFNIIFRGDVGPKPANYIPNMDGQIYLYSYGDYEMGGTGHSSYDEGCNTVDVVWAEEYGTIATVPNSEYHVGDTYLKGWETQVADGFDLQLALDVIGATHSTTTFSSCQGASSVTTSQQMIDFVVFDHEEIPLRFSGTTIQPGSLLHHNVASTSGLIWDAIDYPANLVTVSLKWSATEAQY